MPKWAHAKGSYVSVPEDSCLTQRLALATTLIGDPAVVILDEPSFALDPIGRVEVLDLVARLGHQRTVLFSSHILAEVQRVCDVVGVLIDGRLRYQGSITQLLTDHVQPAWNVRVRGEAVPIAAAFGCRGVGAAGHSGCDR